MLCLCALLESRGPLNDVMNFNLFFPFPINLWWYNVCRLLYLKWSLLSFVVEAFGMKLICNIFFCCEWQFFFFYDERQHGKILFVCLCVCLRDIMTLKEKNMFVTCLIIRLWCVVKVLLWQPVSLSATLKVY